MKKPVVIILALLLRYSVFPQVTPERINISDNIALIKLSGNAYMHVSYADMPGFGRVASNGLIYINDNEAFLFDTPMTDSLTSDLVFWLRDSLNVKIAGFVPNHWHIDCMGGLKFLQDQGIESWANQMTIDIAKSGNLPVPEHGFKDSLQLQLGDRSIICCYPGAAHTLDNIVTWIPSEKILFAGCMVKSVNAPNLGNTADGDLDAYPKTIDRLLKMFPDAEIFIPGHGQPGGIELVLHTKDLATR